MRTIPRDAVGSTLNFQDRSRARFAGLAGDIVRRNVYSKIPRQSHWCRRQELLMRNAALYQDALGWIDTAQNAVTASHLADCYLIERYQCCYCDYENKSLLQS